MSLRPSGSESRFYAGEWCWEQVTGSESVLATGHPGGPSEKGHQSLIVEPKMSIRIIWSGQALQTLLGSEVKFYDSL